MLTTFCVFLLTRNQHPLILPLQIRGNVDAPHGPSRGETKVRVHPLSGPGSKRIKPSAKYLLRAHTFGGAPAVRLSEYQSPAGGGAWAIRAAF